MTTSNLCEMVDGESEIFCEQVTRNLLFHTHDDTLNTILRTDKGIVVAGTTHCEHIYEVFSHLEKGLVLRMQRHPENKHDENAIAIYYEKVRIGWVPRELNLIISRLMDAGKAFFCRIENVELVEEYWVKIEAKIYMVE